MILDIVVPALNEEKAIKSIIERCLAAKERIKTCAGIQDVTLTVVSDGSSDSTEEIARSFEPEIRVVAYSRNRGYGAAIKAGFAEGTGELTAFIDADGTCDPAFFGLMVKTLLEKNADVCIGARLTPESHMPLIRRIGNILWRTIINWMAQAEITDAASGMRVIRRSALELLAPLPDGLHYTPTMSCRAALDARLSIVEIPMSYEERIGRSKLSVVVDGWRFLKTILDVGLTYQPFRLISIPGILMMAFAALLFLPVTITWWEIRQIAEGDIYRILTGIVCSIAGFQLFLTGLASELAVELVHPKKWAGGFFLRFLKKFFSDKLLFVAGSVLFCTALLLNAEGLGTYIAQGKVWQHWSRAAIGGLFVMLAAQCFATAFLERLLRLLTRLGRGQAWDTKEATKNTRG
ncbi:MAG: glycosyltransferase family 2 protein [Candidatus Ozemobacteraceae bacterium]